jgi:hypothetical protein
MGYYISILEITSNPSTGANPVCSKSVDRAVAIHMGDSVRIAEKSVVSEYAGCVIEPRNAYKLWLSRCSTFMQKAALSGTNDGYP